MRTLTSALVAAMLFITAGCSSNSSNDPIKPPMKVVKINGDLTQDAPRARTLNQQATELITKSDFGGAEKLLKQAIIADSEFGPAQNNLGVVYYNQAKPYQAAQQFLLATALLPHDPEPRNGLGLVFESSGRFDDAISCYDRARALAPGNLEYLGNSARARVRRGDHTDELRKMLSNLAANDSRERWNDWARETLAHINRIPASDLGPQSTSSSKGGQRE